MKKSTLIALILAFVGGVFVSCGIDRAEPTSTSETPITPASTASTVDEDDIEQLLIMLHEQFKAQLDGMKSQVSSSQHQNNPDSVLAAVEKQGQKTEEQRAALEALKRGLEQLKDALARDDSEAAKQAAKDIKDAVAEVERTDAAPQQSIEAMKMSMAMMIMMSPLPLPLKVIMLLMMMGTGDGGGNPGSGDGPGTGSTEKGETPDGRNPKRGNIERDPDALTGNYRFDTDGNVLFIAEGNQPFEPFIDFSGLAPEEQAKVKSGRAFTFEQGPKKVYVFTANGKKWTLIAKGDHAVRLDPVDATVKVGN